LEAGNSHATRTLLAHNRAGTEINVNERRRAPRADLDAWVEIASAGGRVRASTFDVSADGLGLTGVAPQIGAALLAEFPLPGIGLPLELAGQVVWSDESRSRAGMLFEDVDPGLREILASYVSGRLGR
jgi:hypothetical protein